MRARRLLPAVVALLGPGLTPGVEGQVEVRRSVSRYPVEGTTRQQIAESLARGGPVRNGTRFYGYTETRVEWTYRFVQSGATCRISNPRVTLRAEVTLPDWVSAAKADSVLRRSWTEFASRLNRHEDRHVEIARSGAERIWRALDHLTGPCWTLRDDVNRTARRLLAELRFAQQRYDEETGHGRKEGVVWRSERPVAVREAAVRGRGATIGPAEGRTSGSYPGEGPGEFLRSPPSPASVRARWARRRCVPLDWSREPGVRADFVVEVQCEVERVARLGRAAGHRWRSAVYRWEFVVSVPPDAEGAGSAARRDTLVETEVVVFREESGGRWRPVWHDRIRASAGAALFLAIREEEDSGSTLRLEYCGSSATPCRVKRYVLGPEPPWKVVSEPDGGG